MSTATPTLTKLILKSQADRRLKQGHLWIYSNEVDTNKTPLKTFIQGQQAIVESASGKVLGIAFINPNGLICGRLVTRNTRYSIDKSLFVHRIQQSLSLRELAFSQPYYRLIYGDSDFLPGLIVDRFGDYLVVQTANAGMDALLDDIIIALDQVIKPKGIFVNNEHSARALENLPLFSEVKLGDVPDDITVIENNTHFSAPIRTGQKTGWFYDHRMNRAMVQQWSKNKRVLDVFSYIGGWGIQAAAAGASDVICVDASANATDYVVKNAALNNVQDKVQAIQGKAIDVLKQLIEDQQRFDVVVLDPPAFIKKKKDQKSGEAAYRHINELGMRLLNKDGLLVSGSCSMHLADDTLRNIVRGAARHLDRNAQIIHGGSQSPDHPIHPSIPETHYLKAIFSRVFLDN